MEYVAYNVQRFPQYQFGVRSLDLNVVKPLLRDSLNEASRTLSEKLKQSDLIMFLLQPHPDATQALDILRSMLTLPGISTQINRSDRVGWTPICYATRAFPEAVEVLLQAGASPKRGILLLHQSAPDQWKAVSVLIRAGYPMDKRDRVNFGRSPLHYIVVAKQPSYRHALELVRHGGHLLDWGVRDDYGDTPFDVTNYSVNKKPGNEQLQLIRELYRTQRIPYHAQFISSFDGERLMDAEEATMHPRISLIDTGLAGDVESIGRLISAGAMVNERDEEGRTLLHHLAIHDPFPNREKVMLELIRHSGYWGIDWDAESDSDAGRTALDIAAETLEMEDLDVSIHAEVTLVQAVLCNRYGLLPDGMEYIFPCMDPRYCLECCSLLCTCPENDVPGMPGSFS